MGSSPYKPNQGRRGRAGALLLILPALVLAFFAGRGSRGAGTSSSTVRIVQVNATGTDSVALASAPPCPQVLLASAAPEQPLLQPVPPLRTPTLEEFPSVPLSRIECNSAEWEKRVCWVHNLFLSGGAAIFVAEDPALRLPDLRLFEFAGRHGPTIPLRDLVRVVGRQQASALFASRPGSGSSGGGGGRRLAQEQPPQQAQQQVAAQQQGAPAGGAWQFRVLEVALGLQPFLLSNWWHASDDVNKAALLFCKYLGHCTFPGLRAVASGLMLINTGPLSDIGSPVREALSCFGELHKLDMNASLAHLPPSQQLGGEGAVTLVRTAVFGIGDEISHPYEAERCGVERSNDTVRHLNIEFLRQCVGLPLESPPRAVPTLRVVNREYRAGRSINGVSEIIDLLKKRKPAGLEVDVKVSYPTGLNYSQQALLFDETDIVVLVHGAATGNLIFLPRDAVVVDFSSWMGHRYHEEKIVTGLPKPSWNVSFLPLELEDYNEPIVSKMGGTDGFQAMPPEDRLHLLQHASFKDTKTTELLDKHLGGFHAAMFNMNIRPDVDQAVKELISAIKLWYAKHRQRES